MALIECSECGGQVSDQAEACPHCGMPTEVGYRLRAERLRQQRLGEGERRSEEPGTEAVAEQAEPSAEPSEEPETPGGGAMVLTKPAGVFCQLIGFFMLLGGLAAAGNDSPGGVWFAFLGIGLFIWGGWSARQHKKTRHR